MINFSVAQDTIKSALIYHLVYLVYGLFIRGFSGLLRKYTLSKKNHMRRPNQSRKHFVFAYNFFNKKKITFPRGLFRTVFTVHAYLLFTSDFNELLNNTVCQNGTVRMQQPRKVRVGVYLYKRDSDCFTQSVDIYLSNRASRFEPSSPNCYRQHLKWPRIFKGELRRNKNM